MKKVVCVKVDAFLTKNGIIKNKVYNLLEENELFWTIQLNNRGFAVTKAFDEFINLKEYRKLKLEKLCKK